MSKTILQLTDATQVNPSDEFVIQQGGITKRATRNELMTFAATGTTTPRLIDDRFADVFHVKDFGAVGNGTTDDRAAIQAAIDAAQTRGGGIVQFPVGVFRINDTLNITGNSIVLRGSGRTQNASASFASTRWSAEGGTVIRYDGTTDATKRMILIGPPTNGTKANLGCGVCDMAVDANGKAGYGLEILSMRGGEFRNLAVADATACNIRINVQDATNWLGTTAAGIRDTQHLIFEDVVSRSWLDAAKDAIGISLGGDGIADTAACHFHKITVIHRDGTGVLIESSGACHWGLLFHFRVSRTAAVTISNASPAVVTWNSHGLSNGQGIIFTTTGSFPSGVESARLYYVTNATTNTFRLSRDYEGNDPVNTSTAGSGTHTAFAGGLGVLVKGGENAAAEDPTGHHFVFCEPHHGGITFSNGTYPSSRCVISNYSTGNGSPQVNLSSKVQAVVTTAFGRQEIVATARPTDIVLTRANIGTLNNSQLNLGRLQFFGRNTSDAPQLFSQISGGVFNNAAGSLVGQLQLFTINTSGVEQAELSVRNGTVLGSAGSFYGIGTINATAYHLAGINIRSGAGTPEGNVTAPIGSLWLRTDGGAGTTLYVKETGSGNTGWVAK